MKFITLLKKEKQGDTKQRGERWEMFKHKRNCNDYNYVVLIYLCHFITDINKIQLLAWIYCVYKQLIIKPKIILIKNEVSNQIKRTPRKIIGDSNP
jgi:hypothetical protein